MLYTPQEKTLVHDHVLARACRPQRIVYLQRHDAVHALKKLPDMLQRWLTATAAMPYIPLLCLIVKHTTMEVCARPVRFWAHSTD